MSDCNIEPNFVRHAKLFELLRHDNMAAQREQNVMPKLPEFEMSEQELLSRALGSLNPGG